MGANLSQKSVMIREPNLIGAWSCGDFGKLERPDVLDYTHSLLPKIEENIFYLYLDNPRVNEDFRGTCYDSFGRSSFEGTLTESSVHFVKTYEEEEIEKGASKIPLIYRGARFFAGVVRPADGIFKQRELFSGIVSRNNGQWNTLPFMMRFVDLDSPEGLRRFLEHAQKVEAKEK